MLEKELKEVRKIKDDATASRNEKRYDQALRKLDEAISALNTLAQREALSTDDAADIRAELADTYGMKGGIYRRMQDLRQALEEYRQGLELENRDKRSTYNASNVITLAITLDKVSPFDPAMQENLDRVIEELKVKTRGEGGDEWWAWSDLGQFYLLRDDVNKARDTYENALRTGPTQEERSRHVAILKELKAATAKKAPQISKNIQTVITDLLTRHA